MKSPSLLASDCPVCPRDPDVQRGNRGFRGEWLSALAVALAFLLALGA